MVSLTRGGGCWPPVRPRDRRPWSGTSWALGLQHPYVWPALRPGSGAVQPAQPMNRKSVITTQCDGRSLRTEVWVPGFRSSHVGRSLSPWLPFLSWVHWGQQCHLAGWGGDRLSVDTLGNCLVSLSGAAGRVPIAFSVLLLGPEPEPPGVAWSSRLGGRRGAGGSLGAGSPLLRGGCGWDPEPLRVPLGPVPTEEGGRNLRPPRGYPWRLPTLCCVDSVSHQRLQDGNEGDGCSHHSRKTHGSWLPPDAPRLP